MNFAIVKDKATELFLNAPCLYQIDNEDDYNEALALLDELVEDYDRFRPLIDLLGTAIEHWEEQAPEFAEFNQRVANLDDGVAVLRTLMDQHQLKASDLEAEIGGKSLVSMILNGTRQLTRSHIQALSERFHVNPSVFFTR
ncbi:MAG: transcriptional regulator [Motiliproteus sp.]|nr:transcriptional regulator [Motiliproteus sp.]MCW9053529.1 transcriptional regulator [Motiliproteus sp.]